MHGLTVRTAIRYFVGVVVVVHGLIHLLGAAGGFGWANVDQLGGPIGAATGAAWLAAAVVTVAAGVALIGHVPWWWIIGAVAVVISQVVIITSWADARIGTIVNGILLVAVIYGWASQGSAQLSCRVPQADQWRARRPRRRRSGDRHRHRAASCACRRLRTAVRCSRTAPGDQLQRALPRSHPQRPGETMDDLHR